MAGFENEQQDIVLEDRRRTNVFPWFLALFAIGAGAAFFVLIHRPLADEARKKTAELEEQKKALRDASTELERMRAEVQRAQGELAGAREELAKASESKAENEKLVEQLKKELGQSDAEVSGTAGKITVTMVERVLFNSGEAEITKKGQDVLRKLGTVLKSVDNRLIQVSGHTDDAAIKKELKKRFPTNWELSTARATNVVRFLQEQASVDPRHLMATGFGPYRPVAPNKSEKGMAKNRRIEILLLPEEIKVVRGDIKELAEAKPAPGSKSKNK